MAHILSWLHDAKTIIIAGHIRPDGDCIGACMALYQYLIKECKDKEIDVYLESIPNAFSFIEKIEQVKTDITREQKYDLFIALDCGDEGRLGKAEEIFKASKSTINIDHHISNQQFAKRNHVLPKASSTCEVLFSLMDEKKIDRGIAEALYVGILHDTGVFRHSCTSKETMRIAGVLMDKEIPFSSIIDESFYQKTYIQNQILGRCLLESMTALDGKVVFSCISQKVLHFYGASAQDLDGIIDQLRLTKGVEVAIFIYEIETQKYKVSMRSNGDINVNQIAMYFGGGGHIKAAGCTVEGSSYDVINSITRHIEEQFNLYE